jgi:hypothetical protein
MDTWLTNNFNVFLKKLENNNKKSLYIEILYEELEYVKIDLVNHIKIKRKVDDDLLFFKNIKALEFKSLLKEREHLYECCVQLRERYIEIDNLINSFKS